ncbi:hypothetical protein DFH29DRAFT_1069871 [Suillus ampliporus]|nr:hypothetical protein DFH29DRAFT_1069871 [Suillus ampliporus]
MIVATRRMLGRELLRSPSTASYNMPCSSPFEIGCCRRDFDELARISEGFSGVDLQALACNAHAAIDEKGNNDDVEVGRRNVAMGPSGEIPVKYVTGAVRWELQGRRDKLDAAAERLIWGVGSG